MAIMFSTPDLTACDREPIHIPGAIQPHGLMLVADVDTQLIHFAAGDVERRLALTHWAGKPLATVLGAVLSLEAATLVAMDPEGGYVGRLRVPDGETFDVAAHLSAAYVVVELEPAAEEGLSASRVLDRVAAEAAGFERALSLLGVCQQAASAFRRLTGFDRVMIYKFLDDGAGKVLAEDKREDLGSFLNHHFPASDIPAQARALYLRNVVRVIPDVSYKPASLRPPSLELAELDMTDCSLRSVSPVHLRYLQNMGVDASASFSIIKDGCLWGLVACHSELPRSLTYDVRAACRSWVGSIARQIKSKEEAEALRQRIRLRSSEDDIVALLSRDGSLNGARFNHLDEIGRMLSADGMAVLRGRELVTAGLCPPDEQVLDLVGWIGQRSIEPIFYTDRLPSLYPPAVPFQSAVSGVLSIAVSAEEPWILLWFRADQLEVINWAGNPHKAKSAGENQALTPRASFASWSQTVSGKAKAWSLPEVEAASRLRAALLESQQNRRMRDLNLQLTRILQDKDVLLQQKESSLAKLTTGCKIACSWSQVFLAYRPIPRRMLNFNRRCKRRVGG